MTKRLELTGKQFGLVTVVKYYGPHPNHAKACWVCKCICGKDFLALAGNLVRRSTLSCGCLTRENALEPRTANINAVIRVYKRRAKIRGIDFLLSKKDLLSLFESNCAYCGTEPIANSCISNPSYPFMYNGLDRKNNNLGYTLENVVACCKRCNVAKNDRDYGEFIEWVRRIYEHHVQI